ncbi:BgTH12-07706 [Blumeria graminis f. sp. triticale]|uniref:BgTH12-07706 n=1 Tax=Blumeria graminis f. sp. triticale TaxID=1689686 RepID=A0A9W4D940_BLUGR|nr:BgTH12-07706 [Blumeria graminis f. sp. triticale]
MRNCIYAFLTCYPPYLFRAERLVITSGESLPFYGVYHPPSPCTFPKADTSPHRVTITGDLPHYGFYQAKYCSQDIPIAEILSSVVKGLVMFKENSNLKGNRYSLAEGRCLKHIKYLSSKRDKNSAINLSETLGFWKCSLSSISELAFRDEISVGGKYSGFAPHSSSSKIRITTDQPIKMNEILKYNIFYRGYKPVKNQALGFYRGDLHLFKQNKEKKTWHLKTSLYPNVRNGVLIANFLAKSGHYVLDFLDFAIVVTQTDENTKSTDGDGEIILLEKEVKRRRGNLFCFISGIHFERADGNIGE